jgi:hypothetical protein
MSTNKELFKEAIADAKAVREAALANAKAALEEALTPKLQSMLAAKLQEMEYEEEGAMGGYTDENLEEEDYMQPLDTSDEMQQTGFGNKEQGRPGFGDYGIQEEDEMEEDFDLSEILAELNEAEEEAAEEEADEESEEESDEDMNVADMSVEELTDLIKSIVDQELEAEEAETMDDEEAEEADMEVGAEMGADSNEDEIDLEELLAELDALGETKEEEDEAMYNEAKKKKDEKEMKKEMEEAMHTIQTLRQEMNEVNLLNAKLLYVNKIFKAKNLTESQKLKVIASFDKATNVKEAKVVFESLNSALQAPAKKAIKESLGFASKATGVAQNRTIVESNDVITRMQKLANIIK